MATVLRALDLKLVPPSSFHLLNLFLVVLSLTPQPCFVKSELISRPVSAKISQVPFAIFACLYLQCPY